MDTAITALRDRIEALAGELRCLPALQRDVARLEGKLGELAAELRQIKEADHVEILEDGTLTRSAAAKLLNMSASALKSMATRREGPEFKIFRNKAYYRLVDIEAWRQQQTRLGARSQPPRASKTSNPCAPVLPL